MIDIQVDSAALESYLADLIAKQLPFAITKALNATASDGQVAMRERVQSKFILRSPRSSKFLLDSIRISQKAHKRQDEFAARIEISDDGFNRGGRGLLAKFEAGGEKLGSFPSYGGYSPVAIPTREARPSPTSIIPRQLYPKNLRLEARRGVKGIMAANRHVTSGGVEQIKGKLRTFVLNPAVHLGAFWGVFQRFGPGRGDIRLLWAFRRSVRIPAILGFRQTMEKAVTEQFPVNMNEALAEAIRTAK